MTEFAMVNIDGVDILVEVEPASRSADSGSGISLPIGAEPTGFAEHVSKAGEALKKNIEGIASAANSALKELGPDEWTVEVAVKFVGEKSPVPIITKLSGEASLKVTAVWKKPS